MDLSSKKVLVTGGAGFIGSTIVEQMLAGEVSRITVVDNMIRGSEANLSAVRSDNRLEVVVGDICDQDLISGLVGDADILIHLAALRIRHCVDAPEAAFEVMFRAPFEIFRCAADAGVEKVVLASSSSIYGNAEDFPTTEAHHPYNDRTLYGVGKLANEGMLRVLTDLFDLHFTALRPFNVYGPRMDIHGAYTEVMVRWMERIADGLSPIIFGDGSQSMDFTYIDDVARAFVLAADNDTANGLAINVGTGVSTSLRELAGIMLRVMESDLEIEYRPESSLTSVSRREADTKQARDRLGFVPRVDISDGVAGLVAWWRAKTGRI